MMQLTEKAKVTQSNLRQPYDKVKQRKGRGGFFSYVEWNDQLSRLLDLEIPFDYQIVSLSLVPFERGNLVGQVWVCHVRVTIDGLGARDGVGTHGDAPNLQLDEESPKAAESDALKRALAKFGSSLYLYCDEGEPITPQPQQARQPQQAQATPPVNNELQGCKFCFAPTGKPHAKGCKVGT